MPPSKPQIPISICLIAKNERRHLTEFNRTLRKIMALSGDEIVLVDTGSTDDTAKRARQLGWVVHEHPELCSSDLAAKAKEWLPEHWKRWNDHPHMRSGALRSFAEARALSFKYAKNEVCFWLDLDDEIMEPQFLRPFIDQCFAGGKRGTLFLKYAYAHDEDDGYCITELWRERVVTRSNFEWKGRCHETLIPLGNPQFIARDPNFPCFIKHVRPKKHEFSDLRNYVILRSDIEEGDWQDPRTMFYLGNACRGLALHDEALKWYGEFIGRSGSRDDVFAARISRANLWVAKDRPWKAMEEAFEAQRCIPQDPRGYYMLAHLWSRLECWENVLTYVKLGDALPPVDTLHAVDPVSLNFQPAALGATAARELHLVDLALEFARRAYQERPALPVAKQGLRDYTHWAAAEKHGQAVVEAMTNAKDPVAAAQALQISPHMARQGIGSPEEDVPGKGRPTLSFFCGTSAEQWGPDSSKTGIGASEKMVMELTKRLTGKFDVSVYCTLNCDAGEYDGVHWRHSAHFNPSLYRDHLVVWRAPQIIDRIPFRAGRIYVWMHDVGYDSVWNPTILARVHKVLFLTEFHRSLHPSVPDDKVYLTRNGIDLERHLYGGEEKQKRIVFCSSPERGFKTVVEMFKAARLPGWELHLFYGFQGTWRKMAAQHTYGFLPDEMRERRMLEYEDECKALVDATPGVKLRGRVTWDEMAQELKEASVWLYPTRFNEISCVAAMEAMAAGCVLVATEHAALKETLADYPEWSNLTEYLSTLWPGVLEAAAVVPSEGAAKKLAEFSKKFDLNALAAQWAEELFNECDA